MWTFSEVFYWDVLRRYFRIYIWEDFENPFLRITFWKWIFVKNIHVEKILRRFCLWELFVTFLRRNFLLRRILRIYFWNDFEDTFLRRTFWEHLFWDFQKILFFKTFCYPFEKNFFKGRFLIRFLEDIFEILRKLLWQ